MQSGEFLTFSVVLKGPSFLLSRGRCREGLLLLLLLPFAFMQIPPGKRIGRKERRKEKSDSKGFSTYFLRSSLPPSLSLPTGMPNLISAPPRTREGKDRMNAGRRTCIANAMQLFFSFPVHVSARSIQ